MTKHGRGPTINRGGTSRPKAGERKGEKPSPGDRGETSSADEAPCPVDMDAAHDRAS
ncbi:MAG: hypothetical protein QOK17_1315 [Sphingomonadales bacterium]|jgi:hypothetical protein|nr:hypothetical protein [Sphingomonadales bacterium]